MRRGIGDIILRIRDQEGYTQEQLCEGICPCSTLARIESNQLVPEQFLLDRFLGRLGKSADRFECILKEEIYELYELRYHIQCAILYRNFERAEALLKIYEGKQEAGKKLHRQFVEQEKAQIAWICERPVEEGLGHLNTAIGQTMALEQSLKGRKIFCAEELRLLLFRWEICYGTDYERSGKELWEILTYIQKRNYEPEELSGIYPYLILLFAQKFSEKIDRKKLLRFLEESLELLRDEARISYMTETLEAYEEILKIDGQKECAEEFREMRIQMEKIQRRMGTYFEKYRLFCHVNRSFLLDYEMVKRSRFAWKWSQEKLCEDVCSVETLSRIERGKCCPSNKNLKLLLERMKRNGERIAAFLMAEQYEVIAIEKRIATAVHKREWDKAEKLLKEMQEKLNLSIDQNRQYFVTEQIRKEIWEQELSYSEAIKRLYEALKITFQGKEENLFLYRLTHQKYNILNKIADLFFRSGEKERAITIWKNSIAGYEQSRVDVAFNMRDWELMTGNMAAGLMETDHVDEAIAIYKKRLRKEVETGRGNSIGKAVMMTACGLCEKYGQNCRENFSEALGILKLMRLDYQYEALKEYMKWKNID